MSKVLFWGGLVFLVTLISVSYAPAQCLTPPSGLVSWWPGDGNADDLVGGNSGTLENGATFGAGKVGQAFSLDGIDDFVEVSPSRVGNSNTFTIALWFKTTSTAREYLYSEGSVISSGIFLTIELNRSGACAGIPCINFEHLADNGTAINFNTHNFNIGNILDDVYHHVAMVRVAADHYQSYVDGQLIQDIDPTPQTPQTTTVQRACIGALCRAGTQLHFNGGIDEVQTFNRALDAPEILAIFNAGSAGTCKTVVILGAEVNLDNSTILISGFNFGSTAPFSGVVKLFVPMQGELELNVLAFDPVTQEILAELPVGIEDTPGTFRLTVDKQSDPPDLDHFGVTIAEDGE
ncbi:LamG domain-containing protein [Acidobacteria bacterium AH-259-A15]|nr:LamG domain-containing protein [Acidobacteria bacterium AH-259-A15]